MIAEVMGFLLVVSIVASLAALAADEGLRRLGLPARVMWLMAMASGPVLLAAGKVAPALFGGAPDVGPVVMQPIELPPLLVGGGGMDPITLVLGGAWVLFGLGTLLVLLRTHNVLLRERADWERSRVLGRDVFVSSDRGPAVAGVVRPRIVLPRWVLGLSRSELGLVLMHEEEHLRARDCVLLAAALALVVLMAWNPVVWWQLRRLRTAMEMDCDGRVLRREPDAGTYGESLITVAARASGPALGLAAFTERGLSLKQRIRAMTKKRTRWTVIAGLALVAVAVLVGVQACFVEISVAVDKDDDAGAAEVAGTGPTDAVPADRRVVPIPGYGTTEERARVDAAAEAGTVEEIRRRAERAAVEAQQAAERALEEARKATESPASSGEGEYRAQELGRVTGELERLERVLEGLRATGSEEPTFKVREAGPAPTGSADWEWRYVAEQRPTESSASLDRLTERPTFTPMTVRPEILNRSEVMRALETEYPPLLRDAGIGGTVVVYFLIDDHGEVARNLIFKSSGHQALDEAALRVARVYRFSPALNGDQAVPVWVQFGITFQMR